MKGQMQEAGPMLNEDTIICDLSQISVWENAYLFSSKMFQELKQAYEFKTERIHGLKKSHF